MQSVQLLLLLGVERKVGGGIPALVPSPYLGFYKVCKQTPLFVITEDEDSPQEALGQNTQFIFNKLCLASTDSTHFHLNHTAAARSVTFKVGNEWFDSEQRCEGKRGLLSPSYTFFLSVNSLCRELLAQLWNCTWNILSMCTSKGMQISHQDLSAQGKMVQGTHSASAPQPCHCPDSNWFLQALKVVFHAAAVWLRWKQVGYGGTETQLVKKKYCVVWPLGIADKLWSPLSCVEYAA